MASNLEKWLWRIRRALFHPNYKPILVDIQTSAAHVAAALNSSDYKADWSVESLREIDRFFDEQSSNGNVNPGGLLAEHMGAKIFAIGAYTGEVIRRAVGGTWEGDDNDPKAEITVVLKLPHSGIIWPTQRALKRLRNGSEDGIYVYGWDIVEREKARSAAGAPPT